MLDDDQDVWADTIFSSCKKAKLGFSLRLERMKMSLCHLARAVFHMVPTLCKLHIISLRNIQVLSASPPISRLENILIKSHTKGLQLMSWKKFNLIIRLSNNLMQIYPNLFLRKFKQLLGSNRTHYAIEVYLGYQNDIILVKKCNLLSIQNTSFSLLLCGFRK